MAGRGIVARLAQNGVWRGCVAAQPGVAFVASQASRRHFSSATPWSLLPTTNLSKEAIIMIKEEDTVSLSHRELRDQALSFAGKLSRDLGYETGDKIALVLGANCVESIIAQLGAALAGVTVVTAKSPSDAALSDCRGIVMSTSVTQDTTPQGLMPHEKHPPIVCHDDFGVGSASVALFWQSVVDTRPIDMKRICIDESRNFGIYGTAKPITQKEIVELARSMQSELALTADDCVVLPVPLAHSFGFGSGAMATLMAGGTLVLPPSKDAEVVLQAIQDHHATVLLCDTHIIKAFQEMNMSSDSASLRAGVVKVGSGNTFQMGPPILWSNTSFITIGKPPA